MTAQTTAEREQVRTGRRRIDPLHDRGRELRRLHRLDARLRPDECLVDRSAAQAWPTAHEWITRFLRSAGDRWDSDAVIAMTWEALFITQAHADQPVRLAARCDGKAAQVRVYVHTSTLPKTEWTAGSPLVEDLLPRLRQRTRRCGAQAQITLDGAQIVIWFALPRQARGIRRLLTKH